MKKIAVIFIVGLMFFGGLVSYTAADEKEHTPVLQTTCPVMEGNPIDENLFVDYQGKRVYLCCSYCKGEFSKNPEKYLSKLPQFAEEQEHEETAESVSHSHDGSSQSSGLQLYKLVRPLGIITFTFLLATATTGLLRQKLKKLFWKIHKPLAITTVALAILHVLVVLLGY